MKNSLKRIFTFQNLAVYISALYICFQVYELIPKVKVLQEKVVALDKEIIVLKTQQQLILNATYETRADVKQILKDVK